MKQATCYTRPLSYCCKLSAALLFLLAFSSAQAITLSGIYFGTCERSIGVILDVDAHAIQLLTLDGTVKKISRFDIVYLAEYPVGSIPIHEVSNTESVPVTIIQTLAGNQSRELARGWPIDFSEQSILFLTTDGDELVISRSDIFALTFDTAARKIPLSNATHTQYNFLYPSMFGNCGTGASLTNGDARLLNAHPQQMIGSPLLIKASLDQLMTGHKVIRAYQRDQKFYAVPQVYSNDTQIGIWYNVNSRHGASHSRSNSGIPFLISEHSNGPFSYQHRFSTGALLLPGSAHEEPQTQISYALKADYFHFSAMIDPSEILIGTNYEWNKNDLYTHDDRLIMQAQLGAGFDWRYFAADIASTGYIYGIRNDSDSIFDAGSISLLRYGLSFRNQYLEAALYYGKNGGSGMSSDFGRRNHNQTDIALETTRVNLTLHYPQNFRPTLSLIKRNFSYTTTIYRYETNRYVTDTHWYQSESMTYFAALDYKLRHNISVSGYISLETNRIDYYGESNGSRSRSSPKSGAALMLTF